MSSMANRKKSRPEPIWLHSLDSSRWSTAPLKRLVLCAFLAIYAALAGCNSPTPTEPDPTGPALRSATLPLMDEGDGDGGGGGGGTGGGTTAPQYRMTYAVYRDRIEGSEYVMKAYTQFEKYINGVWTRVDANNVSVFCYVNGSFRDGEGEINASLVHITFDVQYQAGTQITCTHSANDAYYFATSSYTM
jgi:hypothetical protein